MSDDRKDIPNASAPNWQQRVTEAMRVYMGKTGNRLDRGVTMRDLVDAGIAQFRGGSGGYLGLKPGTGILEGGTGGGGGGGGGDPVPYEPDLTPPPTPTGFTVAAAISNLFVEHDDPLYPQGHGHARTVVYGAIYTTGALPVFSNAVEITQFTGRVFAYPTNPATTWHLWIKWESVDGVLSTAPAGGTNGQVVTTGVDVTKMVQALTGAGKPFTVLNVPTVIGGVTFPAGIYSTNAFIQDLQVSGAKIANLAVDNAKIANVSAAKLTAGAVAVGQYIQSTSFVSGSSGWRINGDGTAEFSNAVVRGTAYIGAGAVGGIVIDSTSIRSSNYNGAGSGFRLGADGTLVLPAGSITVGNASNLLANSSFVSGSEGWGTADGIGQAQFGVDLAAPGWNPVNGHVLGISNPAGGTDWVAYYYSSRIPAVALARYEFSCYTGAHRCLVYLTCVFFNAAGDYLGEASSSGNNAELAGGTTLAGYKRLFGFGTAPAGTATMELQLRKGRTIAPNTSSYAFFAQPFLGEARVGQTTPSPWTPSGLVTKITANGISVATLAALTANLGAVSAGTIDLAQNGVDGGWGFLRSAGKWWTDGQNGWLLARESSGGTLVEFKVGVCRFWMASWGDAGIEFPGIRMTNGGLTIDQVNVIGTLNLRGNSVIIPVSAFSASAAAPGAYVVAQSATVNAEGGQVTILASSTLAVTDDGETGGGPVGHIQMNIYRDGGLLFQKILQAPIRDVFAHLVDYPAAGDHAYRLDFQLVGGGTNYITATNRGLTLLGNKR